MKLSSSMKRLIFVAVLLCTVQGGITRSASKETTTDDYSDLELQDFTPQEGVVTEKFFDIEESKTVNPPSLINDTNVNYAKNLSIEKLAEVDFSTYPPFEIATTPPSAELEPPNPTLEIESDFDILADSLKETLSLNKGDESYVAPTENDIIFTTDEPVTEYDNVDIRRNNTKLFQDEAINDNIIMDRIGLAADYPDDYKATNDYEDNPRSKTSPWKPVWPYAANPSFSSTPVPAGDTKTVSRNTLTTVKPFKDFDNPVSREPVTAYYFDITNTPLPAVGPLHDPADIYGSDGHTISITTTERQHLQNVTAFIGNKKPTTLFRTEDGIIETTPVIGFNPVQDSIRLSDNVYSILNDDFDQDKEEFSVTFSTLLPPIKEIMPTMAVEQLHPKRVAEGSKTSMTGVEAGIQSSIMDIGFGDSAHVTTKLTSSPAHVSLAPITSISKGKDTNIRTPLWVRLSGQSSSIVNSTNQPTNNLNTLPNTIAPSLKVTSEIYPNGISAVTPIMEIASHTLISNTQNQSLFDLEDRYNKSAFGTFDHILSPESVTPNDKNDSSDFSFSTSNSSSSSHFTHSTSNSIPDISVSDQNIENPFTTNKNSNFDDNFNLESSMRHEHTYSIPTETPIITTKSVTAIPNVQTEKSVPLTKTENAVSSTSSPLPKSTMDKESSVDNIVEEKISNVVTPTFNGTELGNDEEPSKLLPGTLVRNLNGTSDETGKYSPHQKATTEDRPFTTDITPTNNYDSNISTTEMPIVESTISAMEELESQDEFKNFAAKSPKKTPISGTTSTTKDLIHHTQEDVENSTVITDARYQAPGEMVLPTTERIFLAESTDSDVLSTTSSAVLIDDGNMIKTVIKHFPGKTEPELRIIEMHSNGTHISSTSPYLKAALSYGVQEFCRHQGNIRSLLTEWVNSHLKNGTDSTSYEVQFFAKPNCSDLHSLPKDDTKTKTVLYFYVMNDGRINPNVTRQYPKNPTNLEISQKLAYLKEKILHLELVNAITSSEDLALEEAAVGTSILAIIISTIILVFVVVSAVFAFVIVKRRRANDQSHGRRCTPAANDTYSMDSVSVFYNSFRRKSKKRASNKSLRSYLNQGFDDPNGPSRALNFGKLTHFISDTEGIYDEFLKIPSVTPKYDEMPKGVEDKNRYANVIPVPETRVYLKANVQTPVEEYINANYIHGARGEGKYYIAAQAPLDETVPDFWQMVWEQECKVIVMLTDFVEKGIDKCADYLPPSETLDCHRVYGDFQVTLKSRDMREKYVVSQVQLKNLENNLVREIAHMWFTGWPYSGIPNEEKSFISYIFETRAMRKKLRSKGPILVHCSPGTGRSGTFIACDISMRNFDDQKSVDIPKTVWKIRRERAGAVQTKEQYAFIYRVTNLYAAKLMTGNLDLF